MIDFKKPIEIFRVNADATFELGKGVDPLVALGELSKAFMKQQERIKRLEEESESRWLLAQSAVESCAEMSSRIKRLEEAGDALYENSDPTKWDLPEANARKLKEQEAWLKAKEAKL